MVRKSIPLARQVAQEILAGIEAGKLARDNGILPSEAELSQRFDVSRATIREALAQLEHRGVVMRRHGVGTFVTALPRLDAGLEELESLETIAHRIGLETRMNDLRIEERAATDTEIKALQITAAMSRACRLAGHRRQQTPRRVSHRYWCPHTILKHQDLDKNFRGSVLDVLIRRRDLNLSHSHTDILIEPANTAMARKLEIKRGEPLAKTTCATVYARRTSSSIFPSVILCPAIFIFM